MEFDFNKSLTVDAIESVPEDFRGLYVEGEDGKFKLNTDDGSTKSAVAAISRLNKALVASRAEAKANKAKQVDLSMLAEYGETPEAILEGFNAQIEEARKAGKGKDAEALERQVSKIKEDLQKAHQAEIEAREKRITGLTGQLHQHLVSSAATSALAEAGIIDPDLGMPFVTRQVKVSEEDGEFKVNVVDNAGDIRYSGSTGAPMTIKELVTEMKGQDKFKSLFKSEAPSGGGAPRTSHQSPKPGGKDMTSVDKIAAGIGKGQYDRGRRG